MIKIIGINGFKHSGKGEVGRAIARNWPAGPVKEIGFADKVKIAGMTALGIHGADESLVWAADEAKEQWDICVSGGRWSPPYKLSGREYLQNIGTEVGRDMFGENFWIDQVLPQRGRGANIEIELEERYPGVSLVAITDLRFENEAERVLSLHGEVWRVKRPGVGGDDTHASEQPLSEALVTRTIVNDGTLADLDEKVAIELANMAAGYERKV